MKFKVTIKTIDNKQFKIMKQVNPGHDENRSREFIKNEILKIARNGFYDFQDKENQIDPVYYPPTSIISVASNEQR